MTCIAAYRDPKTGTFWVGGDSAVSCSPNVDPSEPKVAKFESLLVGTSGDGEWCELLLHATKWPKRPTKLSIGSAIGAALKRAQRDAKDVVEDGAALLVFSGSLWCNMGSVYPYEIRRPYYAIGCGAGPALGVLWAAHRDKVPGKEAITAALECAAEHIDSVRGPFVVLNMRGGR